MSGLKRGPRRVTRGYCCLDLSNPQALVRVQASWPSVLLVHSATPRTTHHPCVQTPVVLQDEDILSDVVPSNIVSRQVSSFT